MGEMDSSFGGDVDELREVDCGFRLGVRGGWMRRGRGLLSWCEEGAQEGW
jgi:hypothetical protein